MAVEEPSEVVFLTRANPEARKQSREKPYETGAFETISLRDIVWLEEYKNEKMSHGCICLMNDGQFKTFLQSSEFVKRAACTVVGRRAKLGLAPLDVPWAIE